MQHRTAETPYGLRRVGIWSFVALMLALTLVFAVLGSWQMQRLGEKEALIAAVAARSALPPAPLPPVAAWADLDPETLDFQPVTLTGRFRHDKAVLVFAALGDARGRFSGPGYWVVTPFELQDGGVVFINRGFVPQDAAPSFSNDPAGVTDPLTLIGMARRPEVAGSFTPEPEPAKRIDWVLDPQRLAALADLGDAPVIDLYVDLPAGEPGELPQGGETVLDYSNRHLEYALTWFAFALMTPILLGIWLFRQRRVSPHSNLP